MGESEYDRLTRRSFEALRRLMQAEDEVQNPGNQAVGARYLSRGKRDRAWDEYLAIEAERKRAAAPPPANSSGST